ncbi:hypothetical protein I6R01_003854 [Salmonella enterica subsp. enterica serovar Cerro]|uniref:Terminase n=3 Tax=Salmonella enterica TaxID=28901 RepID=A0A633DGH6_SALER|nr:hypothetical protein [Salmonella enterica]EBW2603399.1 hypothetical protein [Salmonella enterica subsp. enterica serovar Poano]ECE6544840.1 hypothetical protein [Salmonella enterica subsp. enterica]ECU7995387.1 hypothetical protein [Salmonella enterica subsp. enterica serovar Toucra]EGQ7595635.1 hypothetical protein [Salmonella enterica subsp. enterica serovar Cerro]MML56907.1 hypothetical protein [Salmonella enterica subsp. enterica serovar Kidderminster]
MNQSDEESLKRDYCAGVMTLEEIGRKYGITEGAVRKKARAKKWVRKKVRKSGTKTAKNVPQNRTKKRTSKNAGKTSSNAGSEGTDDGTKTGTKIPDFLPETKPIRGSRYDPPTNAFTAHNTAPLKHGAYARRMLWPDDIIADVPNTELRDELFLLRAANLYAAENIGRWTVQLEDATPEEQKNLRELIAAAEKGMRLNIASIESIEYSIRNNLRVEAATAKLRAEVQKLTAENQGVTTPLTEAIDELQSLNKGGKP